MSSQLPVPKSYPFDGVLRLRDCFAKRSSHSAQDDRGSFFWRYNGRRETIAELNYPTSRQNKGSLLLSRRDLLRGVAGGIAFSGLARLAGALPDPVYPFEEVPPSVSGITWAHVNGKSPEDTCRKPPAQAAPFSTTTTTDGWTSTWSTAASATSTTPDPPLRNALYRNNRDGTFTDVTAKAGVAGGGYGQGVAVGDYDGDGFPDLYVTQYGRSILYHNNGDGTFTDVTEKAGVAAPGWASSAVWFDYDNDGRLDLFVCQFVEFSQVAEQDLRPALGTSPDIAFRVSTSRCRAGSSITTATAHSPTSASRRGSQSISGKAWGVVATDLNNDGRMDLFVANDTVANFLFMNRGRRQVRRDRHSGRRGLQRDGRPRSGMGVDSADFNQDGWMDLFVANIDHEIYSHLPEQSRRNF